MKKQLTDWEKIFTNDETNEVLVSKICKQLNVQKTNNPIKNGQKIKQILPQRRYTDGQEAHEKMFNIANY